MLSCWDVAFVTPSFKISDFRHPLNKCLPSYVKVGEWLLKQILLQKQVQKTDIYM